MTTEGNPIRRFQFSHPPRAWVGNYQAGASTSRKGHVEGLHSDSQVVHMMHKEKYRDSESNRQHRQEGQIPGRFSGYINKEKTHQNWRQ